MCLGLLLCFGLERELHSFACSLCLLRLILHGLNRLLRNVLLNRLNLIGTILCIMSVLPLFLAICLSGSDLMYIGAVCLLLGFVALACIVFVYAGTQTAAMEKLLEEGDYTRQRKSKSRLIGTVSVCYWLVVTAIFMFYTFGPYGNAQAKYSWFIWAIAGILYGAVMAVLRLVGQGEKKK